MQEAKINIHQTAEERLAFRRRGIQVFTLSGLVMVILMLAGYGSYMLIVTYPREFLVGCLILAVPLLLAAMAYVMPEMDDAESHWSEEELEE